MPGNESFRQHSLDRKVALIATGILGSVFLLCCGGCGILFIAGSKVGDQTRTELAEADTLWSKGDKTGAAAKYRGIVETNRLSFLTEEQKSRAYGRLIDTEFEAGRADAGADMIAAASSKNVSPAVEHPEAKKAVEKRTADVNKPAERKPTETKPVQESKSDPNGPATMKVSKGFLGGSIAVTVLVPKEITVSDGTLDGSTLNFKLHWKGSAGRPVDPWHYSAYDGEGLKIDGGSVGIPHSMELGQKVKARIVLRQNQIKDIARIDIHE